MDKTSEKERINEMIEAIMKVARGDYAVQIKLSDKNDDLDSLAMGLNMMIDDIRTIIIERKQAEEALKESRDAYQATFEATGTAMLIGEEDTTISMINAEFEKLCGYSKEEVEGKKSWIEFIVKADLERMKEYHHLRMIDPNAAPPYYEFQFIDKQGNRKEIFITLALIPGAKKTVGSLLDITERKRAEEALQESEKFSSRLLDNSPNPILVINPDTSVKYVNHALEELTGLSSAEIIGGKAPYPWWTEETQQKTSMDLAEAMRKGARQLEELFQKKNGERFWVEITSTPVRSNGEFQYYLANWIDITERKRAEEELAKYREHLKELVKARTVELEEKTAELQQANIRLQELDRLKSMFIASMSHELRTPLNSIIGFTGIILRGMTGEITEEQRKQLTMVKNSANHLLALINDVIDVSKIEADKVELAIEEFDLSALVQEVKDSFSVTAAEKSLKMPLGMPETLTIESDERRTKQVIMNLVDNAVKFTDKGEIELKMTKKDRLVEVSVRDTGIGIRKEYLDKLFTAFRQIPIEGRLKDGTGLGLYLSKKIADLLGGEIKAESEFGKGSEFTFILPIQYEK